MRGGGGLFNLAKKMVSVLHKDLECIVEKLKNKKSKVVRPNIKKKFKLPGGK